MELTTFSRDDTDAVESWADIANSWIAWVERGDPNRNLVLDPVMLELAAVDPGTRVLDVGCGEGRFGRMLAQRGAEVVGLDPTRKLLDHARDRGSTAGLVRAIGERLPIATASFDLVTSYVTLVDIAGYRAAIREMARVVKPGGAVLVANLNPFATTSPDGWIRDDLGNKLHVPVDRYLEERPQRCVLAGGAVVNWHRPMQSYMEAFLATGLRLERFLEPPSSTAVAENSALAGHARVPWFHVMLWRNDARA